MLNNNNNNKNYLIALGKKSKNIKYVTHFDDFNLHVRRNLLFAVIEVANYKAIWRLQPNGQFKTISLDTNKLNKINTHKRCHNASRWSVIYRSIHWSSQLHHSSNVWAATPIFFMSKILAGSRNLDFWVSSFKQS